MSYLVRPDDKTPARAFRRIAQEQSERVLAILEAEDSPAPETIHDIRKRLKKLRALYRLMAPALPDQRARDRHLRDAARHLAALREADVRAATLRRLLPEAAEALQDRLGPATPPPPAPEALAASRAELQALLTLHGPPRLAGKGFSMLETGLSTTLHAAGTGFHQALCDDSPEVLHDWRKRVKDHLYHCRLLAPLWPEMLQPRAVLLNRLAEALGDRNDLTTLSAALPPLPEDLRERVETAIAAQHASLAQIALPLGARLFSEPPEARARHWRALWHIWQAEA